MNTQIPPPLPSSDAALRTYLRAGAFLIPTVFVWLFNSLFVLPKLEQLWEDTGLTGSKVQWLLDVSFWFMHYGRFIFAGLVLILLLLEFNWSRWPHYRRTAITCATLFIHTAVLVGITAVSTAALLAAPLLGKKRNDRAAHGVDRQATQSVSPP